MIEINRDESFTLKGMWRVFRHSEDSTHSRNDSCPKEFQGELKHDSDKKNLILSIDSHDGDSRKHLNTPSSEVVFVEGKTSHGFVYLFNCFAPPPRSHWANPLCTYSYFFVANCMLIGDDPLAKGKELNDISWKNFFFKAAKAQYKNLLYWTRKSVSSVKEPEDGVFKIELERKNRREKLSNTLTYEINVESSCNLRAHEIFGDHDFNVQSFIQFDFSEGKCLYDIYSQLVFLSDLLHFSMLPYMATYIFSMKVVTEKDKVYKLLWTPFETPPTAKIREDRALIDCFVRPIHLKKIADCFEEHKNNQEVQELFRLFTRPSYAKNEDVMYAYTDIFRSMECASRVVHKENWIKQERALEFLFDCYSCESHVTPRKLNEKVEPHEKDEFIEKACEYRNNFVHARPDFSLDPSDKMNKTLVISRYLVYQIQKELFKLPEKEIKQFFDSYAAQKYPF